MIDNDYFNLYMHIKIGWWWRTLDITHLTRQSGFCVFSATEFISA